MPLVLTGLSHRTAAVELRERLSIPARDVAQATSELRSIGTIDGAVLLSTCNRVEIVVSAHDEEVTAEIVDWLAARTSIDRSELERHIYILRHADVVTHLCRVTSGLDSMLVGEPQIAGQVKDAFLAAQRLGALDPLLQQVFENTMRVARKVRSETGIGQHAVSVPYAAVELAKKIFGDLRGLHVLLLGAGDMGELTAEYLHAQEAKQVFVANRSFERAAELAERFQGEAVRLENAGDHLSRCDIVIASTGAPHFLIGPTDVRLSLDARRGRNLFLVDLSVPRNIDPEVAAIDGVYLYDIDDLQQVADSNLELRQQKAGQAEEIIGREVEAFGRRLVAQDAVPTILELQQRLESIRTAEIEKCLRRMGPITSEQKSALELFSTQLVNKILHYPILQLKDGAEEPQERESLRRTIRRIFGLR